MCWDNLEKLKLNRNNNFSKNRIVFYEYDTCLGCGEPYLGQLNTKFCDHKYAQHGKNNSMFGKKKPEWSKKMMGNKFGSKGGYASNNIPMYDTYAHQLEPYGEQCRRNIDDPNILEVKCIYCGKWHIPKRIDVRNRINSINDIGGNRFYCSPGCKILCPIFNQLKYPKSYRYNKEYRLHQRELKDRTFNKDNGVCQKCGIDVTLKTSICHHEIPVAINGLLSLDDDNAWTLCISCHKHVHNLPRCSYIEIRKCANITMRNVNEKIQLY
jgi:5-methylcytosine-specific restriction endonuclease McrA